MQYERLSSLLDSLEPPTDGDSLAELLRLRDRVDAKLTDGLVAFDQANRWDADAATSLTAWLRQRANMARRDAVRLAAIVTRLARLPATLAAWCDGHLTGGQVVTMVAAVDMAALPAYQAHETALLHGLRGLSPDDTAWVLRAWRARFAADEGLARPEPERSVHLSSTIDGQWILDGSLDAVSGHVVEAAVRLASTNEVEGEPRRTPGQRRADALVDVCRFFLDHQTTRVGGRHRPHLNVVVDVGQLVNGRGGRFLDGHAIDGPALASLACDSAIHRVVTAGRSAVLDYGTTTRTIPAPLWNSLVVRDEHCRFPGCDRPSSWCDGHHLIQFHRGGPTSLDNLVLLCARHHHRLHQPGWHASMRPDGTLQATDPAGLVRTSQPPRALCAIGP